MIKRRFYREDRPQNNGDSETSSSSSDDDSDSSREVLQEEYEEEGESVATREVKEEIKWPESPGSGYAREYSSGNDVECDSSGLLVNEDEESIEKDGGIFKSGRAAGRNNVEVKLPNIVNTAPSKDSVRFESSDFILKSKSVFKCRLCPRIVCLSADTLRAHLTSKRHARSKKLLNEGRLKLMLNSDGEIEEEQETHAERHARTLAIAETPSDPTKKNKGRQRQKARKKKFGKGNKDGRVGRSNKPKKKRRKIED